MSELALIIVAAAALAIGAKLLRQPLLLAYLATGALVGYLGVLHITEQETFRLFSDLGIMFLLFLVGLEINYASLRLVGKASLLVGLGQIIFTFLVGFLLALFLDFSSLHAAYIAIALTFSSTIIVVKLLSDKKDLNSLYGKISIGFLLVQDFIAIIILILLSSIQSGGGIEWLTIILTTIQGILLFILMLWLGRTIFPPLFDKIAHSQELLFLTSLAWVFLLVALVDTLGFSIEIGGFLAGLALANSSEHFQIASRIRPLRDFFIIIFFVILGSLIILSDFSGITFPIILFSLFVLIGNPLIVLTIMGFMGYRKRTSFLAGVTVAQISEFSLVLAALGLKVGHITDSIVALITAVGIVTITISTYLIMYADKLLKWLSPYLALFERKIPTEDGSFIKKTHKPIILIGYHRTGQSIARAISKEDLLVIDFNPDIINTLKEHNIAYLFDDIRDPEVIERANIQEAKVVISTSPDFEDNMTLLIELKKRGEKRRVLKIILRAQTEEEAKFLYTQGADYVLLPDVTAGQYLGNILHSDPELESLEKLKEKDWERLTNTPNALR